MTDLVYAYIPPSDENHKAHLWTAVGSNGGVHVHARPTASKVHFDEPYYGGIEVHSKTPMYGNGIPSQEHCWLIGCPCYHDGSSLYFSERIAPMLGDRETFSDGVHQAIYAILNDWYYSKLDAAE